MNFPNILGKCKHKPSQAWGGKNKKNTLKKAITVERAHTGWFMRKKGK